MVTRAFRNVNRCLARPGLYFCVLAALLYARPFQPQTAPQATAPDMLKAIDRLAEQNRQLEAQNQNMTTQINALRAAMKAMLKNRLVNADQAGKKLVSSPEATKSAADLINH